MGRTVPSFRIAVMLEEAKWGRAGRRLNEEQRQLLEEMSRASKLYASAASMSVRTSVFESFFMSLLFDTYRSLLKD